MSVEPTKQRLAWVGVLAIALLLAGCAHTTSGDQVPSPRTTNGRIAYIQGCCAEWIVYTVAPDGTGEIEMTTGHYEMASGPTWSPDGTKLAFGAFSTRSGWRGREIGVMDAEGSHIQAITHTDIEETDPEWTPDGTRLLFIRSGDLFSMAADGSDQIRLGRTRGTESDPEFSPSGTRILFASTAEGRRDLFTMAADGTDRERLTDSVSWEQQPHWNATGDAVLFTVRTKSATMDYDQDLWSVDATTHVATPFFNDPAIGESGAIPSPDGTRLAWVRGTNDADLTVELVVSDSDGSNLVVAATCTMDCEFWDLDWQAVN